ncbi:hypothetical protein [Defluviimonas salinarum]|uniref:Uncharacterized protein n=1 Tax=Defluviimonas salinarum TaxID=2992147 RepID=A0ABT3J6B6_9RHOB|nr:hypothetical protein [Defluviimonas salinarum]MCW3782995.1 hypothetical protein [Defluviimonas salinarum]
MSKKITLFVEVEIEEHVTPIEAIAASLGAAIDTRLREGVLGAEDEMIWQPAVVHVGENPIRAIAGLETWNERCVREIADEMEPDSVEDIVEGVHAAQTDLDYLTDQSDELERRIVSCREVLGLPCKSVEELAEDAMADLETPEP